MMFTDKDYFMCENLELKGGTLEACQSVLANVNYNLFMISKSVEFV